MSLQLLIAFLPCLATVLAGQKMMTIEVPDSDVFRSAPVLIKNRGYDVEEHKVTTKDGFILGVQRIPRRKGEEAGSGSGRRPVVFLQHGLTSDAGQSWIIDYPNTSLGFILADRGFDVWLGNVRGNRYSREHKTLKPCDKEFWNWSFQELAEYDLPAMIEYALKQSNQEQLYYVGHSQGTLMGFIAFSSNPTLAKKVKQFFALAPVYYFKHTNLKFKLISYFSGLAKLGIKAKQEIEKEKSITEKTMFAKCEEDFSLCKACIPGFLSTTNLDIKRVPVYLGSGPSGTSMKTMYHFAQIIRKGYVAKYDYGLWNWNHYQKLLPPAYHVDRMTIPCVLYYAGKDELVDQRDVLFLKEKINNGAGSAKSVWYPDWGHADFLWAVDAPERLYPDIIKRINAQENTK